MGVLMPAKHEVERDGETKCDAQCDVGPRATVVASKTEQGLGSRLPCGILRAVSAEDVAGDVREECAIIFLSFSQVQYPTLAVMQCKYSGCLGRSGGTRGYMSNGFDLQSLKLFSLWQ